MRCCDHREGALGRKVNQAINGLDRLLNQQSQAPARLPKSRKRVYYVSYKKNNKPENV